MAVTTLVSIFCIPIKESLFSEILNDINVITISPVVPIIESSTSSDLRTIQVLLDKVHFQCKFINRFVKTCNVQETQIEIDDLKRFIIENGGEYLLNKYSENSLLSDPHRKALVAIIVKKLTIAHTFWPTTEQKIQYAKLAVELLPTYKTAGINNFVSVLLSLKCLLKMRVHVS